MLPSMGPKRVGHDGATEHHHLEPLCLEQLFLSSPSLSMCQVLWIRISHIWNFYHGQLNVLLYPLRSGVVWKLAFR